MAWMTTLATSWGACIAVGAIVAYYTGVKKALAAGAVSLAGGVAIAYGFSLVVPTQNLTWAVVAVGDAAFFAGLLSYLAGYRASSGEELL